MAPSADSKMSLALEKSCFVTIGATAGFDALVSEVLDQPFLEALKVREFTDLVVQYGQEGRELFNESQARGEDRLGDLRVSGFDYTDEDGMHQNMVNAKKGVVVCHAGSGSILKGLHVGASLIVVPNDQLLDNHQLELAEELARLGYVSHGKLGHLASEIHHVEDRRQQDEAEQMKKPRFPFQGHSGSLPDIMKDELFKFD